MNFEEFKLVHDMCTSNVSDLEEILALLDRVKERKEKIGVIFPRKNSDTGMIKNALVSVTMELDDQIEASGLPSLNAFIIWDKNLESIEELSSKISEVNKQIRLCEEEREEATAEKLRLEIRLNRLNKQYKKVC